MNLAVLRMLNERGIEIPYPQRVLHGLPVAAPVAPPPALAQPGNSA